MPRVRLTGFLPWRAVTLVMGVALFTAACNGSSTSAAGGASSSTAASSTAASSAAASSAAGSSSAPAASGSQAGSALCADVAAVRDSVAQLTQVKLSKDTVSTLTADVNNVTTKLTNLGNAANGQWSTQTGRLKTALASLQASVQGVSTGGGSIVKAVASLGQVLVYAEGLVSAARSSCPSVPGVH